MIPFKLGEKEFNLPTSYGELTYSQYDALLKLPESDDFIGILSILSGLPREDWELCQDSMVDIAIMPHISFLNELFDNQYILPDTIEIEGKRYQLPGTIEVNTFGQKLSLQRAIARAEKQGLQEMEIYPYIVALYMQPIVTESEYSEEKVEKLQEKIKHCRINEVFPIASFFLLNSVRSLQKKQSILSMSQLGKKSEQGYTTSKSSENYQRFSPFRRFCIKVLRMFFSKSTRSYI
jgi:hypothetical protein